MQLSDKGWTEILTQVKPWLRRGTVTGYGGEPGILWILRDGTAKPKPYHHSFWVSYQTPTESR